MAWMFSTALVKQCASLPFLQEQEGESLEGRCLDGERSAPLRLTGMQQAFLWHGKTTDFSRLSRFGMTYAPLTDDHGEAVLTSFLAAFPVRTFLLPEEEQACSEGESPDFGDRWLESLARYDRDTCSWKTLRFLFPEDLTSSLETLPRWGMTRNGELFRLNKSERRTGGSESGLSRETWPTPRACSAMAAKITPESASAGNRFPNLETIVGRRTWPTPDTGAGGPSRDAVAGRRKSEKGRKVQVRLVDAVIQEEAKTNPRAGGQQTLASSAGGYLNPVWVEWLMGWPLGWTDLKPLGMDRFREWLSLHGVK